MLDLQLSRVFEVLVLATAAVAKILTARLDSIWRGVTNAEQPRASKLFLDLRNFCLDDFSEGNKGNKDDQVLKTGHSFAAEGNIFNREGYFFAERRRHRESLNLMRAGRKQFLPKRGGFVMGERSRLCGTDRLSFSA